MTVPNILADLTPGRHHLSLLDENFAYLAGLATGSFTGVTINPSAGLNHGITITQTLTGSATLGNWNSITIPSDNVPCDFTTDFYIEHHYGSATHRGTRSSFFGWNVQDTANSGGGVATNGVGGTFIGQSNSGDGGTNLTNAGVKGAYFGINAIGRNAGTNVQEVVGVEADLMTTSASSARYTFGYTAANYAAVQGSAVDAALGIYSGGSVDAAGGSGPWGPGVGFHYGICFAELSGNGLVPIDSGGTLIGSHVESAGLIASGIPVANGIDLSGFTFSGSAFKSNLFSVSQNADVFAQNYWANGRRVLSDTSINIASSPPATAASTGTTGNIVWDSGFLYVCVATNTWKRAALSTW